MKKSLMLILLLGAALFMTGCGKRASIPPAHRGKIMTETGYKDGLYEPSTIRLPWNMITPPKLVLVETSDKPIEEPTMKVFIPKDKLNLTVDIRGTYTISAEEKNVNKIFDKVKPSDTNHEHILAVSGSQVYNTYAKQAIREASRTILTQYTIDEIMTQREQISNTLFQACSEDLADSPIELVRLGFADIQPPDVIVNAQEAAKEREIEIQRAEADKQIALAQADAALEVARKQQEVDLLEAETQVLVNTKLAEGVTEAFITQRGLKVLETMASSDNKIFFLPQESFKNPAMLVPTMNAAVIHNGPEHAKVNLK